MGGLGAKQGPPAVVTWRGIALIDTAVFSAVFSLRVVPWLAILGLCLLKPNRRWQAWLVWLPLLAVTGITLGSDAWLSFVDSSVREMTQLVMMSLGFGWAAVLLLAPWAPWPRKFGYGGNLLLVLGVFALLRLVFGHKWGEGMFDEIMGLVCAVILQFVLLGLATAASLAGWSARRGFSTLRFLGWLSLWLIVVWVALVIPSVTLALFGDLDMVAGLLIVAGCCCLGSWVVTLPFLILGAMHPSVRHRLQRVLLPSEPSTPAQPEALA